MRLIRDVVTGHEQRVGPEIDSSWRSTTTTKTAEWAAPAEWSINGGS